VDGVDTTMMLRTMYVEYMYDRELHTESPSGRTVVA
jgi:hypothetical protein